MANVLGVQRTKAETPIPANIIARGIFGGCDVMTDYYEASATTAAIEMGKDLIAGDVVHAVILSCDALGSETVDIGDSDDATRYASALSVASAASLLGDECDGVGYTIGTNDGDETILVTPSGAITGTIKLTVLYSRS